MERNSITGHGAFQPSQKKFHIQAYFLVANHVLGKSDRAASKKLTNVDHWDRFLILDSRLDFIRISKYLEKFELRKRASRWLSG